MANHNRTLMAGKILGTLLFLCTSGIGGNNDVSLSMEDCLARALTHNNQIRSSRFAVSKASWDRKFAWSQLLPSVTFNTRYTWIDDSTFALRDFSRYFKDPNLPFKVPQTVFQKSYYTSLDVDMPLFNGNLLNGLFIASANKKRAEHISKSVRDNIIFQVISGYLSVLKAQEIFYLQQEYLELSKMNFQKAERLEKAGRYSRGETLRWKVDFQQQKAVVVNSETALRSARSNLNRLIDLDMDEQPLLQKQLPEKLMAESHKLMASPQADILQLIQLDEKQLTKVNAALAAAKSTKDISKLLYRNTYASYLPNISLIYSYSWWENATIQLDDYSPQTLMINFSLPLFTGFKNLTSTKAAYYDYKKSQADFRDQILDTKYLLTETVNRLLNLKNQRDLSRVNVEYSEHNYRVVETQREKGLVSNLEFLDAKLNLQSARLNEINVHYDFISTMIELYYLLGRLDTVVTY